ncbi:MAG: D-2-hydroxyacid dehydrogenase [Planctomycetota bacterium]
MTIATPRLVVLDGYTLNPGDLSWERLLALGHCSIYDRTSPDAIVEEAAEAELVLTNKAVLSREVIEALPQLKYIGVTATGYNVVDIEAAREREIVVTNVPIYGTESVAQMVFAHVLHFAHRVSEHSHMVHEGHWSSASDWCFWSSPQQELQDLTMGIVGFGRIGRATAKLADAFGMKVLVASRSTVETPEYAKVVDLDTLFSESDYVSLHCPLTDETNGIVSQERLQQMKPSAVLINSSRGPLIDEWALADALRHGQIAGAGLDVLSVEPPPADHPLLGIERCAITPHIAWATRAARSRLLNTVVDNVAAYLAGRPQHVVS